MTDDYLDRNMSACSDFVLLLGRVLIAAVFIQSGFNKLTGLEGFATSLGGRGLPAPYVFAVLGAVVEFFGGLAVLVGFKTRWAALLMLLFTIVATALAHRFWAYPEAQRAMQQTQFMKNLAIMGGFLFLFVAGAGAWSVDRRGK